MEVGLGQGYIVLDGNPAPLPKKGAEPPNFQPMSIVAKLLYVCIRIPPFGMEVSLSLGNIVLDGDPAPRPPKKGAQQSPISGPCLLWPNGWVDQDATWYGSRPRSRSHCTRRRAILRTPPVTRKRSTAAPPLSAHVYCGHGHPSQLLLSSCLNITLAGASRPLSVQLSLV